ncbi:MAG: hypothetical protein H6658_08330 [Ardenticatenaceae bacterium]|nr:hypothetical protein [Ardenticatenaceae bacterium]
MKKRDWPYLILGFLLTTVVACRPITEEDPNIVSTESAATSVATAIASQPTMTATVPVPEPTLTPTPLPTVPLLPTAVPTRDPVLDWQRVGSEVTGLQVAVPPDWLNLSSQLDVAAATNQLGVTTLFLVDAERTGASLLSGKEIGMGAFVMGVMNSQDLPVDSPRSGLNMLLSQLATAVVREVEAITADSPSGTVAGAMADIIGDPVGFPIVAGQDFQMRLLLFSIGQDSATGLSTQAILLMGTTIDKWAQFDALFDQIMNTVVVYNVQSNFAIGGGQASIVGELPNGEPVRAALAAGVQDIWTFSARDGRYATLALSTELADLDLRLTIVDASGQVVAMVDNGYTGDTEIAADVLLVQDGRYFVEVEDFFDSAGRYELSLSLSDEPLYSGGGRILLGQTIQSVLPPGQHLWQFEGTAGETVSIVLIPDDERMDGILNLYGPDGRRLAALDEGFSGDAELISGFELPVTGEYTILVTSFADVGGAYSLSLNEGGEVTQNFYEAGDLVYGDVLEESLQSLEVHTWYFTGQAGDRVTVKVMPLDPWLDVEVWLLDANVERLATQDEFLTGEVELVDITLPAAGQYIILVRDYFGEAGRYEITLNGVTAQPPSLAGNLTYGESVATALLPGMPVYWLFAGHEGDVIDVTLTPVGDVDFLFRLQDPNGNVVMEVDEASLGNVEQLLGLTLTADGNWRIVVDTFFAEGGSYSLLVESGN